MIQRWVRKPEEQERGVVTARYEFGLPLDELLQVAQMADPDAELVQPMGLRNGPVLLVHWMCRGDQGMQERWDIIKPGEYLGYSETYDSLGPDDEDSLLHWYTLDGEIPARQR
jgi:hypothetical protein